MGKKFGFRVHTKTVQEIGPHSAGLLPASVRHLSRNDAVENGSARDSRAVVGVSPTTCIGASASPNGASSSADGPVGATPTGAAGTAALPKPNESFRLRPWLAWRTVIVECTRSCETDATRDSVVQQST